ncbi:hypothetical protein HD594_000932 [Microbacterium thalassium]|uniref:Uncharacterized protein n=1 Tax=Microbacterium thalassium TaxID=362649 RepID=A0A7X0KU02_9MICO|nr:hypothetical protein [Microbacterium thalassium]
MGEYATRSERDMHLSEKMLGMLHGGKHKG